ncbi:MAG TPA: ribbon-helix-helix protein, CopG family [Candidatus Paceibacterota bacterium]
MPRISKIANASSITDGKTTVTKEPQKYYYSRKDRNVSVDLTPELKKQVQELAQQSGLSLSDYMRACLTLAAKRKIVVKAHFTIVPLQD